MSALCHHLKNAGDPPPRTNGCEECLRWCYADEAGVE